MTKYAAMLNFWNSFGIPAYVDGNVPEDAVMPYITYSYTDGDLYTGEANNTVDIWYYTNSEETPNSKLAEVSDAIGLGGCKVKYDGGLIWIKKGSPWAQPLTDPNDNRIKRRTLNVITETI